VPLLARACPVLTAPLLLARRASPSSRSRLKRAHPKWLRSRLRVQVVETEDYRGRSGARRKDVWAFGWWLQKAGGGLPKDGDRAGPFERYSGQIAPITLDESSRPNPTRDVR